MQAAAEEEEDQPGVPAPRPPQVQVLHPLGPLKQPGPQPHTEMDSGQGFSANTVQYVRDFLVIVAEYFRKYKFSTLSALSSNQAHIHTRKWTQVRDFP